jgi:hypothetical protein
MACIYVKRLYGKCNGGHSKDAGDFLHGRRGRLILFAIFTSIKAGNKQYAYHTKYIWFHTKQPGPI